MKKILIFILILMCGNLFAQQDKKITFIDNYNKPIEDVLVFYKDKLLTITNENGNCFLDNSLETINCKYFNIIDTIVDISNCSNCNIRLKTSVNLLNEVSIEEKADYKKLFLNLLKKSDKYNDYKKSDTTIYYKINYVKNILGTDMQEIFSGIIKITAKANKLNDTKYTYICHIDNYYNDIVDSIYNSNSLGFNINWIKSFWSQNHLNRNYKNKEKAKVQAQFIQDEIIFIVNEHLENKFKNFKIVYVFKNNKIKSNIMNMGAVKGEENSLKNFCLNTVYSSNGLLVINSAIYENIEKEYKIKIRIELDRINYPIVEDFSEYCLANMKLDVNYIKKQYPNSVIPSNPEPFYKFDFFDDPKKDF